MRTTSLSANSRTFERCISVVETVKQRVVVIILLHSAPSFHKLTLFRKTFGLMRNGRLGSPVTELVLLRESSEDAKKCPAGGSHSRSVWVSITTTDCSTDSRLVKLGNSSLDLSQALHRQNAGRRCDNASWPNSKPWSIRLRRCSACSSEYKTAAAMRWMNVASGC